MVIKKDGRRERFSRDKITEGIKKACQKRPVSITIIDEFVDSLELYFQELMGYSRLHVAAIFHNSGGFSGMEQRSQAAPLFFMTQTKIRLYKI